MNKRIFMIPWHGGHQAALFKIFHSLGFDIDMCINYYREWDENTRPLPDYVKLVTHYEPGKYAMAILHVDQQLIDPTYGKTKLFKAMRESIDCPVVVLNHGTPHWEEKHKTDELIVGIRKLVRDDIMVVNSHKAAQEWGWGVPVIHGFQPDEFKPLPKEPRIITGLSPAGLEVYYNRGLLRGVKENLQEKGLDVVHLRVDYTPDDGFEGYKEYIARSLIYFDPSVHTPMNRARTEAMLSGCCLVQTNGCHDEERFLRDTVNCFLVPNNPMSIGKKLEKLIGDYQLCKDIGRKGREDMIKYCDWNRYTKDWERIIKKAI